MSMPDITIYDVRLSDALIKMQQDIDDQVKGLLDAQPEPRSHDCATQSPTEQQDQT